MVVLIVAYLPNMFLVTIAQEMSASLKVIIFALQIGLFAACTMVYVAGVNSRMWWSSLEELKQVKKNMEDDQDAYIQARRRLVTVADNLGKILNEKEEEIAAKKKKEQDEIEQYKQEAKEIGL